MTVDMADRENLFLAFEKQIIAVNEEVKVFPERSAQILTVFLSNFYEAVKESVRRHGIIVPHYFFISEKPFFGTPPITDEIVGKATEMKSKALVSVEGFQSNADISDILYHVSLSAHSIGVMGWVFRVKIHDKLVEIVREMPYLFDSASKVKTLGELEREMG